MPSQRKLKATVDEKLNLGTEVMAKRAAVCPKSLIQWAFRRGYQETASGPISSIRDVKRRVLGSVCRGTQQNST